MFHLTVKSGMSKDTDWAITAHPLRIGREKTCDVRIPQTVVSRQHCEIYLEGGIPRLKHLGSVNPTFVNGLSAMDCTLEAGDEIKIGHVVFLITSTKEARSGGGGVKALLEDTLAEEESVYLSSPPDHDGSEVHPKTDDDLNQLFLASRAFSRVSSHEELIHALGEIIQTRFQPDKAWLLVLGQFGAENRLVDLLVHDASVDEKAVRELHDRLAKTLKDRRGILIPEYLGADVKGKMRCTMATPVFFGEHDAGAILIERTRTDRIYHKADLHFMVALAHIVAPFFRAIEHVSRLETENRQLRTTGEKLGRMIGQSKAMGQVQRVIDLVAPSMQPVFILGSTGTGKELVAGLVHELSNRSKEPLVIVNCAAIPRELFESEFFGYEKGAFTGATARKIGMLEQSDKGTLFLDEIGDLSLDNQARILRAVETGRFRRVGGMEEISADFRVIAATNKDLAVEIKAGRFREDLYHRLRSVEIRIPELAQRRSDIPELAQHFLQGVAAKENTPLRRLSPKAMDYLLQLSWPGNVRQLKRVIEAANALCRNDLIDLEDLLPIVSAQENSEKPLPLEEMERRHIAKTLEYTNGNMVETARLLGIGRSTLYNKLNEYGLKS